MTWRSTLVCFALMLPLLGIENPPAQAARVDGPSAAGEVQVWNASLRLVGCTQRGDCPPGHDANTSYWKQFFDRAADSTRYPIGPDVFILHEAPKEKASIIMDVIRARVGGTWTFRHSDPEEKDCATIADCGNSMVAWRTDKFDYDSERRWKLLWRPDSAGCRESALKRAIAVRLTEEATLNKIVFAGLHLWKLDGQNCTERNVSRAEAQLAAAWSSRPVTVLAGDFNKLAHECGGAGNCADRGVATSEWRRERNADDGDGHDELACWYKALAARHSPSSDADCGDYSFDAEYYDAIWERERSSDPTYGICASWTFDNVERDTDQTGGANSCESLQKRIDFLWVRWETSPGIPTDFGAGEVPAEKLANANTDRGWASAFSDKYSDHRALRARISW
ncbi:MAG: hypothetical protein M3198_15405 [Actinomycetota bacterium]|nr:hypothetical protein [Actinomycetota bacterium]